MTYDEETAQENENKLKSRSPPQKKYLTSLITSSTNKASLTDFHWYDCKDTAKQQPFQQHVNKKISG